MLEGGTMSFGQVALGTFANPNALRQVGLSQFTPTVGSGTFQVAVPNQPGVGAILSGNLEQSNTDLTSELTDLIRAQQAFSANSKMLETRNSMVQKFLNS
jgi:fagellar hook-basal body proteins